MNDIVDTTRMLRLDEQFAIIRTIRSSADLAAGDGGDRRPPEGA